MGSVCQLQGWPANNEIWRQAMLAAHAEVARLESKYSRYRSDSVLSRINAEAVRGAVAVDAETAGLLNYAAQAFAHSDGLFDISSGVLRRAWDFSSRRLPVEASLAPLLAQVGWQRVHWNGRAIKLKPGMELDLGGLVKEYAADCIAAVLRAIGLRHGLINLGGDIAVIGPHPDGQAWQVGVVHPRRAGALIAQLPLSQGGLATSGDYERFMMVAGRRYCHLLNPHTGWPVDELAAVTVVAEKSLIAGTSASIAMLKGRAGLDWLSGLGLAYFAVDRELRSYCSDLVPTDPVT